MVRCSQRCAFYGLQCLWDDFGSFILLRNIEDSYGMQSDAGVGVS